ncbi:protein of unknown function [Bradyrhizobium sp. ORS 285]|uniref:hypothetical protein n=1 Tax=Bradyrhizobium sp. ORS 285 TaxID=115808 RepID=UPI00024089B0|nr:hypothetical protein [Bradyrhizobium sp. ORS 285]CCD86271.1 hypothetical protein BRAO285_1800023 [Bradyrhizobium sp. ORS 285]SMX61232.1 protein of unknown function [Bradyrhizobium sp. ORS 285]
MASYRRSMKPKGSMSVPELRYAIYGNAHPQYPEADGEAITGVAPMPPAQRPQDPYLDGRDMRFNGYKIRTLEQGGEYPDTMPQVIEAIDADGRTALYVPLSKDGKVIRIAGFLEALKTCGQIAG